MFRYELLFIYKPAALSFSLSYFFPLAAWVPYGSSEGTFKHLHAQNTRVRERGEKKRDLPAKLCPRQQKPGYWLVL